MWRKLLRGLGCLSYLGTLMVLFGLVAYVAFSFFVRGGVTATPELFGLPQDEAVALLADQGLRASWSEDGEIYDEKVARGHVVRQEPKAGVYVKRANEVVLTISLGPRRIEVPRLEGEAIQSASVALGAVGLKVGWVLNVFSEKGESGFIVAHQPPPGARVAAATTIDVLVSSGGLAEVYVMPDLVKRNYDGVRGFFEARGFRMGKVSYESYEGVSPGTVLRQFPLAGHPLRRGDVISLDVVTPLAARTLTLDPPAGTE